MRKIGIKTETWANGILYQNSIIYNKGVKVMVKYTQEILSYV